MSEPVNGSDGWSLEDYHWSEKDGLAEFTYSRGTGRNYEERVVTRSQPWHPRHDGWGDLN